MTHQTEFTGWKAISIEDLLVAYRKAKADCYFENSFPTALKFAKYEQDLLKNLSNLRTRLQKDSGFESNDSLIGEFRILPKGLTSAGSGSQKNDHIHFSDPGRAFDHMCKTSDIVPEFRIVGDFPVDTHIISALWINSIGHKLDARLDECSYATRLVRIQNDTPIADEKERPYHINSVGSFRPYFLPYQNWRNDGLKAIRNELEQDREIIAVSLDLMSYYHRIDPLALASKELYEQLDVEITPVESEFTNQIAKFLKNWSNSASQFANQVANTDDDFNGGLVIGLTASRIISNVILHHWDRLVIEKLSPIHYGRYVDDMILVMRDPGSITNRQEFMEYLQERLGESCLFPVNGGDPNKKIWRIQLDGQVDDETQILLQSDKQKLFVLKGNGGIDLLDSIEKEINELSSEYRLMPSPDKIEDSTAARVLSATSNDGESSDTLRHTDTLTIRRRGWALQLRHVETLAQDLPRKAWKKQRKEFYQFAHDHILRPDKFFTYFQYLPRLFGFAVGMNDWKEAERIVLKSNQAVSSLKSEVDSHNKARINGKEVVLKQDLWHELNRTLALLFSDAEARHLNLNNSLSPGQNDIRERVREMIRRSTPITPLDVQKLLQETVSPESTSFEPDATLVALADLANLPYKQILQKNSAKRLIGKRDIEKENQILEIIDSSELADVEVLKEFLKSTRSHRLRKVKKRSKKFDSFLPYIFPTRPLTPSEISELAPVCVGLSTNNSKKHPSAKWAEYTKALRGIWVKPSLLATELDKRKRKSTTKQLKIGTSKKHEIVVALTNIKTEDTDWAAMACGRPNLSRARYQRISELVKATLNLSPKPDYVLFPELSIPLRWVNSIAARLSTAGISLIAGTEYRHYANDQLRSEAVLVLADNRLGYPNFVKIWQPKLEPGVHEEQNLYSIFGKSWAFSTLKKNREKPVYIHDGFNFGVMICSELLNSKARIRFQGNVDALLVLSWNKDLDTFSSLVESTALDVHAYTILVNDRKYGDSRIRSPAKESFMRDIVRVRGGDNDFVVAATIDIDVLRAFQSRAKRWPQKNDQFKPLPEGFILSSNRKRWPPK